MRLANIWANNTQWMLICSICRFSCIHGACHIILVDLIMICRGWFFHAFSYCHIFHILPNSLFLSELLHLHSLLLNILFPLLLVNLCLQGLLHRLLLHLSLLLHHLLLISSLPKDVSIPFKVKIHTIWSHSTPCLDIRKVLLCDTGIEVAPLVVMGLIVVHIERLICIRIESVRRNVILLLKLLLRSLVWGWDLSKVGDTRLSPLLFFADQVTLFDLLFELVGEVSLLEFFVFINGMMRV